MIMNASRKLYLIKSSVRVHLILLCEDTPQGPISRKDHRLG